MCITRHSAGALGYLDRAADELHLPATVVIHGTPIGELRTQWRAVRTLRGSYRLARLLLTLSYLVPRWRRAASRVEGWIAVSQKAADEWGRLFTVPSERIAVISNGVDTGRFRPDAEARAVTRARLGIAPGTPVLLGVGRLEWEKGFQVAIEALRELLARVPEARLIIAGDGHHRAALERPAARLGGAVTFAGHVPNQQLPELLAAADIFLMPTLCDEAFPLTIVEAMAAGLPVIATRLGGIPSAVEDGITGVLVPPGDSAALGRAAERLLAHPSGRSLMAGAARQAALARFGQDRTVAATERLLETLIDARRERARRTQPAPMGS